MLGQLDIHMQKNKFGLLSQTIQKIISKWIKDQNISINIHDLGLGNFLYMSMISKAQVTQ